MDALVLAAGLGRRLYPLTGTRPKCLVPVSGRPLVELVLERLELFGLRDVAVTAFHLKEQVRAYFAARRRGSIHVVEERELLGTGGGVRNALATADAGRHLLVHNCDIVSDVDLAKVLLDHCRSGSDATLVTRRRDFGRSLAFDRRGGLIGRARDLGHPCVAGADRAEFCGIHVLGPRMAEFILQSPQSCLINMFILAASRGLRVRRHDIGDDFWMDIGTLETLAAFERRAMPTTEPLLHIHSAL